MVVKYTKKRTIRRRNIRKRMYRMSKVPRAVRQQQLTFKRKFFVENWQPNTITTNGFWRLFNVAPSLLPEWSSFISIFDVYKVTGVLIEFVPKYSEFSGNDTVANRAGTKVHVVNDPYSIVAPSGLYNSATLNSMLEQGNCKTYSGNRTVKVFTRPTTFWDVGGSQMVKRSTFIRTDSGNTGHKCCHVFMQDQNFTGVFTQNFDIFYTYYITFKNLR